MKELFIGTGNKNKILEFEDICKKNNLNIKILSPKDFNDTSEPYEDGFSFEENAIIKARYYFEKYKIPCLAEDSGICIDYFNNAPGIHSKRLLSEFSDGDKNEYVLELMKDIKNRKATFHTSICYIDEVGIAHIYNGINEGEIAYNAAGNEGFGYDPIFYIPSEGKTEAELGNDYKNKNSHRAKAFKEFIKYLQIYEKE